MLHRELELDEFFGINKLTGHEIWYWNVRSLHKAGSLKTEARALPKQMLDSVRAKKVRWDMGGTEPLDDVLFSMEMGM
jgi:hypothetical protein